MFKIEEVKKFKFASEELLEQVKTNIVGSEDLEDISFEFNGVSYSFNECGMDDEIDEGKYTTGCKYYQLCSFDKEKSSYPCKDSELDDYNILVELNYSKSGSYFSDYEWYFNEPIVKTIGIKVVPEVIVPEHEEVYYK